MLIILSPAKTLDFTLPVPDYAYTTPAFLETSKLIARKLKTLTANDIKKLMGVSDKIAQLNYQRFQDFKASKVVNDNTKAAGLVFKGDVYQGLKFAEFNKRDITYAQKVLRILSGLYGILNPLDLIQAYRLEMGTSLSVNNNKNLYALWQSKLTKHICSELNVNKSKVFVNLASNEYAKAINLSALPVPVVSPQFKDYKNGKYKMISFFAKKARGMMARFIIQQRIKKSEDLKAFNLAGYYYAENESTANKPVFYRD